MEKEENPIYERNTLEFVTVALEYCTFVEAAGNTGLFDFVDKATKLLPLLYLKASLLPEVESEEETELELSVSEDMYESVRSRIAGLLGERDSYLETFHADMRYSDTPIAAFISENLADVYQDTGNFVSRYRKFCIFIPSRKRGSYARGYRFVPHELPRILGTAIIECLESVARYALQW